MTRKQQNGQEQRFAAKSLKAYRNKLTRRTHRAQPLSIFGWADMFRRYWGKWDRAEKRAWKRWRKTRDAAKKWGLIE